MLVKKFKFIVNYILEKLLINENYMFLKFVDLLLVFNIYLLKNWKDNDETNLFGYACILQSNNLLNYAIKSKVDFKNTNNEGKNGLHLFLENSYIEVIEEEHLIVKVKFNLMNKLESTINFIMGDGFENNIELYKNNKFYVSKIISIWLLKIKEKKEIRRKFYEFKYNNTILDFLLNKSDIDISTVIINKSESLGWEKADLGSFKLKNIIGTPLEILVLSFWLFLYEKRKENDIESFINYESIYLKLINKGAHLNELTRSKGYNDSIRDAMQDSNIRIGSSFFAKFIKIPEHLLLLSIILKSEKTDLLVKDSNQNNLIHTVFYRLLSKNNNLLKIKKNNDKLFNSEFFKNTNWTLTLNNNLDSRVLEYIFNCLLNNSNFNIEMLKIKSGFNQSVIDLLEINNVINEKELINWFNFIQLEKKLTNKDVKKNIKKI